jgi:mRNA-degrading endonuclease RelE of RelBE toxin-antitoxin system
MSYRIEFDPKAIEDLRSISVKVQSQILKKINWLGLNFEPTQTEVTLKILCRKLEQDLSMRGSDRPDLIGFD